MDCLFTPVDSTNEELKTFKILIIVSKKEFDENNIVNYVNSVMNPYDENKYSEPRPVENYDELIAEYESEIEMYDNFEEFCMKNYGAYFNDDKILVSSDNDEAFWETFSIGDPKKIIEINEFIDSEIKIIFDENAKLFRKSNKWIELIKNIITKNIDNYAVYVQCT